MKNPALIVLLVSLSVAPKVGADGTLDPSFGGSGFAQIDFGPAAQDAVSSVVVLPDGRAVVAGYANINLEQTVMAVARVRSTGKLDPTFDGDGRLVLWFSPPPPPPGPSIDYYSSGEALLLQPDGRLVVVGGAVAGFPPVWFFTLARLNVDGSLDSSFGTGGKVSTGFPGGGFATAGLLQPDGRIVAVGNGGGFNPSTVRAARYNTDGSLDATFGTGGLVTLPLAQSFRAEHAVLQPDGRIVIAASAGDFTTDFTLVRLLPDGSLDPSFDDDGIVNTDFGGREHGYSVVVLGDGRIVLAGSRAPVSGWKTDVALVRYLSDGSVDTSFGVDGLAIADFQAREVARQVLLLPNGKLLVAGHTVEGFYDGDWLLTRFDPDGDLDTSFGTGGFIRTDFFNPSGERCYAAAIAGPDLIMTAGAVRRPPFWWEDFAMARYIVTTGEPADGVD